MMKLKLVAPIALLALTMPMLAGCADKKPAETAVSTEETRTVVQQPVETEKSTSTTTTQSNH
jgi:type IV pilus biogenesis protein CpaD/CtpE